MRCFAAPLLLAAVLALSSTLAPAIAQPARWGDLEDAHTALDVYAEDSSAAAVVLFDVGEARITDRFDVEMERHRRVKLFTEAGYDQATISIVTFRDSEDVSGVRGQTFVPDGEGGYRRVKMDRDAVFRERVGDSRERITFTLPALAPGAIFEYRYRINTESLLLFPTWYFQDDVPVLHSEFEAVIPRSFNYVRASQGTLPFDVQTDERVNRFGIDAIKYRWVRTDVPALREEPFVTTLEDYIHKIEFQLAEYSVPGYGVEKVLDTWETLADDLDGLPSFGGALRSSRALRSQVEEVTAGLSDPAEKMAALYDYVRTSIRHDGRRGYLTSASLKETLEERSGSAADLNLLLLQMLREADIGAVPVLLSTRDHGLVQVAYPLITQFNYVAVLASVGNASYWLDATDPMRPMGLLPAEALAGKGWVPDKDAPMWIPIDVLGPGKRAISFEGDLGEDGTLTAAIRLRAEGYDAIWMRRRVDEASPEAFMRDYLSDMPGVVLDSARVESLTDLGAPLDLYAYVHVPDYAQTAGDLYFFNPVPLDRYLENPFTSPERLFPVDFNYPRTHRLTGIVRLPEGFVVDEMPDPVRLTFARDAGTYQCQLGEQAGQLVVRRSVNLRAVSVEPRVYPELRAYYDRMVSADDQMVVLKRGAPAAEAPAESDSSGAASDEGSGNEGNGDED
ncbi:MAG: DUF3857 domain-containing protein [Bacteroidota bacterium]